MQISSVATELCKRILMQLYDLKLSLYKVSSVNQFIISLCLFN